MASRWQKKSQEEKDKIKKQQEDINKFRPRNFEELQQKIINDEEEKTKIANIFRSGKIPMLCMRCHNHTDCDKYIIGIVDVRLGGEFKVRTLSVGGRCNECGKNTIRKFPEPTTPDGLLYLQVIALLKQRSLLIEDAVELQKISDEVFNSYHIKDMDPVKFKEVR